MRSRKNVKVEGEVLEVGMFNNGRWVNPKVGREPEMLMYIQTDKEWIEVRMSMTSAARLANFFDENEYEVGSPTCRFQ